MEQSFFECKTIFLISPESWDYISVSKHHYAIALANRGNKVYFINPPVKKIPESIVIRNVDDVQNLFVVNYKPIATGLRFFPPFIMHYIERKFLKKIEQKINGKFDVILNFENSRFYDFRFLSSDVLKIYFQVDQNQYFHPAIASRTADIVFAINDEILGIVKPFNENSFKISHSFQGNLSAQAQAILDNKYVYVKPDDRLKVVYVGNLDNEYIDYDLFEEVINKHPEVDFLLIGPYSQSGKMYDRIHKYTNAIFLGKVSSKEIPEYLSSADMLMLIYSRNFTFSSHKLLEYLGSGKAIASTYMSELAKEDSLVEMSESHSEYGNVFTETLNSLEQLNISDKMKARILFALNCTYPKQLDKMESLIKKTVPQYNN